VSGRDGLPAGFDPRVVRAVAMDLDRTLIPSTLELTPVTVAAVAAAQEAGIAPIVATGRMFRSARPFATRLGVRAPLICYQGALVADPVSGEWLRHEPLPVSLAREVIEAFGEGGFHVNLYVDDRLYVERMTEEARLYAEHSKLEAHVVGPLLEWLHEPTTKIVAVGNPAALDGFQPRLHERFEGRLFVAKSLPEFLEVALPGVNKGTGLRFVCEHLGLDPASVVAFGDGQNDIELLEAAGLGVAVSDADPRLLEHADWTVPSAEEDGVASFLQALVDSLR
jgi:Cof subfamily protein (haloacid dehalogenase superfamily)